MTAPDRTPDTVFICTHVGEYGQYFPEAVEAEGEYGGEAVAYTRATPAPVAMTPEVAKLVEAAWQMLIEYDEANIEPEPRSMTSAAIRLRAALAALRAGENNGK